MGDKWCLDNEQTMKDSAGGKQGSKLDCCDPIATEEALIQSAPLPHERVLFWGSGSPQGQQYVNKPVIFISRIFA